MTIAASRAEHSEAVIMAPDTLRSIAPYDTVNLTHLLPYRGDRCTSGMVVIGPRSSLRMPEISLKSDSCHNLTLRPLASVQCLKLRLHDREGPVGDQERFRIV